MIRRVIACMLGIASPSRVAILYAGGGRPPRTWLDRWERRIDMQVVRRMIEDPPPVMPPIWMWDGDDHDDEVP